MFDSNNSPSGWCDSCFLRLINDSERIKHMTGKDHKKRLNNRNTVENYPDLKATQNFQQLQGQLEGIENGIKNSRKVFKIQV